MVVRNHLFYSMCIEIRKKYAKTYIDKSFVYTEALAMKSCIISHVIMFALVKEDSELKYDLAKTSRHRLKLTKLVLG